MGCFWCISSGSNTPSMAFTKFSIYAAVVILTLWNLIFCDCWPEPKQQPRSSVPVCYIWRLMHWAERFWKQEPPGDVTSNPVCFLALRAVALLPHQQPDGSDTVRQAASEVLIGFFYRLQSKSHGVFITITLFTEIWVKWLKIWVTSVPMAQLVFSFLAKGMVLKGLQGDGRFLIWTKFKAVLWAACAGGRLWIVGWEGWEAQFGWEAPLRSEPPQRASLGGGRWSQSIVSVSRVLCSKGTVNVPGPRAQN